jgi:protein ImuB
MRDARSPNEQPLAVSADHGNAQVVTSANTAALSVGVYVGQPVRDAHAVCANLLTRAQNAPSEAAFLTALRRWAGKFSPWVSEAMPDGLVIDITGCAHLFGGETALASQILQECTDMGLTASPGIADTLGAAWALARFAGQGAQAHRSGDAIAQEARATRARAVKRRHWTRGGAAPQVVVAASTDRIAPIGQAYVTLSPLPVAALRLTPDMVAQLNRLGLRCVGDLLGQPRAGLARRFGKGLLLRLDQAMGSVPEPVSPARATDHFAVRLTLPDPIGLQDDMMAGIDRMLPKLCQALRDRGRGARRIRLEAHRADGGVALIEIGLARPARDPDRMRPLLEMKLTDIDAGFGIDMLRLVATQHEPIHDRVTVGHLQAGQAAKSRIEGKTAVADLIGRLGARVGLDAITRLHPVSSHIPEKSAQVVAAAWSEPASDWPMPPRPRPMLMWPPEPVTAPDTPTLPDRFRWRGRIWALDRATGPERIAPEWWLEDPQWRSGVRDYWVTTTQCGAQLWLFYAHGGAISRGWFCQGNFS